MSTYEEGRKAICILSFDNGGPGTYSQLLILKEYMSRLVEDLGVGEEDVYPADHFDLMGGVGFGGLVAILLGYLQLNVDEAIDALIAVATAVFPEDSKDVADSNTNSRNLKGAIEDMLRTRKIPVYTKMYEQSQPKMRCKVVLYAATSVNIGHPQPFRTYSARGSSLNPTIVEAVCATMAVTSHFLPVKIGLRLRQQSFIGGPLGANNPTRELLNEASTVFGKDRRVAQIVSIGSGLLDVLSIELTQDEKAGHRLLVDMSADCEMVARELAMRLYNIGAYLRLNVDRGMKFVTITDWDGLGDVGSHTNAYIGTTVVTQALNASLRSLRERIGVVTLEQLNQSSSIKIAAKMAPSVSPYFVLRTKEWDKLVWHLVTSPLLRQRILPITGMGGCGKTQLVSYFLQKYPFLFKHVAYVNASTLSSIKADLQEWSRALGDGHEREMWEDAIRILASASEDERLGLILDNADNPTLNLVPFIPKSINLTVIITSRNRNMGNLSTTHHMELGEMDPNEALATLLHAARRQLPLAAEELKNAHTLLKELGRLAVALVQAGTYCHELSISFTKYLTLFKSHRADLMKRPEPSSLDSYERGAYTTLDLSYKALPQVAREFLRFISFFHHTDIPLTALATAAEYNFQDSWTLFPRPEAHSSIIIDLKRLLYAEGAWSEMHVQDILRTLRSFSLLSITSIGEAVFLQLHPLIQSWSRDMDPSTSLHYRSMAVQTITPCCRDEAFQLYRQLIPHILDMLAQGAGEELHIHDLMTAGKILKEQGHYQAAAGLFKTALEVIAKTSQPMKESAVSGWLAEVYRLQGRWNEAEKLQVKLLEQIRRILGIEHPDTLRAAGNLASTYRAQGRWNEAEKVEVEVLEKRRKILGMERPETIIAAENLAATYRAQGRWNEAEKLGVEVLKQQRRILGEKHPETILAAGKLAFTYQTQGRWSEAEKLGVESLEQCRRVLGMEHPDTISIAANLAVTYGEQGRWEECAALLEPVVELALKVLGQRHPQTQSQLHSLVFVYEKLGKEKEAQDTRELLIF